MTFLFDCDDAVMLPRAYDLVDDVKAFFEKMKTVDVSEKELERGDLSKVIMRNMLKKYPEETSALLAKLWVLEPGEKAPRVFKTISTFCKSEEAVDFFTSVLPFLVSLSSTR